MISSQLEKLSCDHAAQLAASNQTLMPATGTPLAELVAFSSPSGEAFSVDGVISANSNNPEHDQAMDSYAQVLADAVAAHTAFARNVVTPALERMQAQVREGIQAIQLPKFMDFQIEEVNLPRLYKHTGFMGLLARYRTNTTMQPKTVLKYPQRTNDEILATMLFSDNEIDDGIKDLVTQLPDGHLQVIWQSVFQNQVVYRPDVEVKTYEALLSDYLQGGASALIIFLLSYRLNQDDTDNSGVDLSQATELLNCHMQRASSACFRQVEFDQAVAQTNTLVRSYSEREKRVVVNGGLFREWTNGGGKPEVLLGISLLNEQPSTISQINALADTAEKAWNRYVSINQSEQDAVFDSNVRLVMRTVFDADLESDLVDSAEKEQLAQGGVKAFAKQRFAELLKLATPSQLRENFADVFWRAACQARYHYTGAYGLLSDVDYEVKTRGQDLDDALTTAQNNYACAFLAEQIVVGAGGQKSAAVTLANAAQLAVEVLMRLPRNGSAAISGNFLTRTSAGSLALTTIRKKVQEQAK